MTRSVMRRSAVIVAGFGLFALLGSQASVAVERGGQPTLAVAAIGSLPGMKNADVPSYLAEQMNGLGTGWKFSPVADASKPPPDRIEWSFAGNPSAAGAVRTYGFSRFVMQRLIGVHPFVSVQATLYLHDEYQTQSIGQVGAPNGVAVADLTAEIARDTRQLIGYSEMDTRADGVPVRRAVPPS